VSIAALIFVWLVMVVSFLAAMSDQIGLGMRLANVLIGIWGLLVALHLHGIIA
jgi:hypothetical protein